MKGYALLIGVDETDKTHYKKNYELSCANRDIEVMSSFLDGIPEFRENIVPLQNSKASWENTKVELKNISQKIGKDAAFLVIFYSGHGASLSVDESNDKTLGFFGFYDKMVTEYQIRGELAKLERNIKTLVISDSCYSGELIEPNPYIGLEIFHEKTKNIEESEFLGVRNHQSNKVYYDDIIKNHSSYDFNPRSETAIFAACSRKQTTEEKFEEGSPSVFTHLILSSWSKNMRLNYTEFYEHIQRQRPYFKMPQFKYFGERSGFFEKTTPFILNFDSACINDLTPTHLEEPEIDETNYWLKSFPSGGIIYSYVKSDTYEVNEVPLWYQSVITSLSCDVGNNINYYSIVEVMKTTQPTQPFPQKIVKLFRQDSEDTTDLSYGYVIVIDSSTHNILHKGRTKGRVSNAIG